MYKIARIVNTFGIKGQVKVIADTDFPQERFKVGNKLWIMQQDTPVLQVTVKNAQLHKGTYLLSFDEFHSINDVEKFKSYWLAIDEDQQHDLEEDAYYHHQIIGLKIVTTQGITLGKVKEILSLGSNDVWVVQRSQAGKKDVLIPFINDVVKSVNLQDSYAEIELMEGLIDDEN